MTDGEIDVIRLTNYGPEAFIIFSITMGKTFTLYILEMTQKKCMDVVSANAVAEYIQKNLKRAAVMRTYVDGLRVT